MDQQALRELLEFLSSSDIQELKLEGDERIGADIVRRSLEAPMRQISSNAGVDGSIVIQTVRDNKSDTYGYNARTGKYEDMIKAGVVDPAKVTCAALQNAEPLLDPNERKHESLTELRSSVTEDLEAQLQPRVVAVGHVERHVAHLQRGAAHDARRVARRQGE